jgi:hypothetical protein
VLGACASAPARAPASETVPIDVVFDLDWTLLYASNAESAGIDASNVVHVEDKTYRLADYAQEAIAHLLSTGRYRVSFFSGGQDSRNAAVVARLYDEVKTRTGRRYAPHAVGGFDELTRTSAPDTAPFAERLKKDLKTILPDVDLERAVLIDDSKAFAPPGQEGNMLWLQATYEDAPDLDALSNQYKAAHAKYLPPDEKAWALERNKIAWAVGVIEESRLRSEQSGRSFREELDTITRFPDGRVRPRADADQVEWTRRGLAALGARHGPFERRPPRTGGCRDLWPRLLHGAALP